VPRSWTCTDEAAQVFVVVLLLAGMDIPIRDHPLGGPFTQPNIGYVQPSLDLPWRNRRVQSSGPTGREVAGSTSTTTARTDSPSDARRAIDPSGLR
jgi:hypothetical protein